MRSLELKECVQRESLMVDEDDFDEISAEDLKDHELFDISDVELDFQRTKGLCKLYLIMKSDTPINLMRYYLKLKEHIFQLESDLLILDESPEVH